MSTFTNAIAVSGAVVATSPGTIATHTLYTVPANSYVKFNCLIKTTGASGTNLKIGGVDVASVVGTASLPYSGNWTFNLVAGPGQAIQAAIGNLGDLVTISGVLFTNGA